MATPYYVYGNVENDAFKKRLPGNRERYTSVVQWGENDIKRYFSSIDTDVYFGDTRIDEMVAFDFMIEEKKIPLYGYNTYTPKRIMTGQKTIQGSFAINFTKTFNLKYILDEVAPSLYANDYEMVTSFCGDDNMAIFNKGFDITISYGDAKNDSDYKSYNACTQTLVGCYITSYRQAFDTSGEPILDMYTFIAKDLIVQDDFESGTTVDSGDTVAETQTNKETKKPEDYRICHINDKANYEKYIQEYRSEETKLVTAVNPLLDYVNNKYRISMIIDIYERDDVEILNEEIKLTIKDSANFPNLSRVTFTLKNKVGANEYYWELSGKETAEAQKMQRMFTSGELDSVDCSVIVCAFDHANFEYNMALDTYLRMGTTK